MKNKNEKEVIFNRLDKIMWNLTNIVIHYFNCN